MKKAILVILLLTSTACARDIVTMGPYVFQRRGSTWQCGYQTVRLGERYKSILAKCGDPDNSYYYQNDLGLRVGTVLKYSETILVIKEFQNEFPQSVKQISYKKSPVYLYFDRWGIYTKIHEGDLD